MLFWNKTCGFIAIFFISAFSCMAQEVFVIKNPVQKILKSQLPIPVAYLSNKTINKEIVSLRPLAVIPQDHYTQHFGMMCKKELAIEKATRIPFRFRLGSLQQCNYLEGKK